MRVAFRVDASLQIGTGHVMRCLTLARAFLNERGAECHFICREFPGNLIEFIKKNGFAATGLAPQASHESRDGMEASPLYSDWLGASWGDDAWEVCSALEMFQPEWLVVDHYALDARWEQAARSVCRHLMVIDDLADRSHDCDLLLDQNLGRRTADYRDRVPANCTILTGPQYALLRPEFAELRQQSLTRRKRPQLKEILISMGGVDHSNVTGRVLETLRRCPLPRDTRITVVMGLHAPWLGAVQALAAKIQQETQVLTNVTDMAVLMARCDLAIGAAGLTAWERCCLGVPTCTVVLAENQRAGATALAAIGATVMISNVSTISDELPRAFNSLLEGDKLKDVKEACSAVTDGLGTTRVMDHFATS